MKLSSLPRALLALAVFSTATVLLAQAPKTKSAAAPADPAADAGFDAFFKLRDQKEAPSLARFEKIIKAGLPLLAKSPKHRRAPEVIRRLTDVAGGLNDKATLPLREVWFSQLKLAVLHVPGDSLDDDGRAALLALSAASACAEARLVRDKEAMENAREKIDALAAAPGGQRFLADQEMNFVEVLRVRSPEAAEKALQKLAVHPDKGLAGRASDELRIIEVRKTPFDLKLTTVDGKEFDAASLRGKKALYLHFWTADSEAALKEIDQLKDLYAEHRDRIEIVSVNLDTAENRAKADAVLKEKRLKWPQVIEGAGNKSETASRLTIRSAPMGSLFDPKGILVAAKGRPWQIAGELKKMGYKF